MHGEAGPVEVDTGGGQRQMFEIAGQLAASGADLPQHGRREIERQRGGCGELLLQQGEGVAGAAAGIEDVEWLEAGRQAAG